MLLLVIRVLYALVCGGAIAAYVMNPGTDTAVPDVVTSHAVPTFFGLLALSQLVTVVDLFIRRKRIEVVSAIYFGLLIGTLLGYLLVLAVTPILKEEWKTVVSLFAPLVMAYLSISLLLQTKDDFRFIIPFVEFSRELKGGRPLILDSSALIDGRIADVIETRIIDSKMIVPTFVLKEVQDIADSSDKSRRTRGRRGLDVLAKLQSLSGVDIEVQDFDDSEFKTMPVDQKLIRMARHIAGRIVTGDFNLNKVAGVQGVEVVNLNDVAAALRPRFLPGDTLHVKVQREGEGHAQGVGYLDDGTMVVIEMGNTFIGQETDVVVTSVLQSSAGRMIFARPAGIDPPAQERDHRPSRGR